MADESFSIARAAKLTPERRGEIAEKSASARWNQK